MTEKARKIGLIAGGGNLPFRMIDKFEELKISYVVVALDGFGPEGYETYSIGSVGGILEFLKSKNVTEIMFCGAVKRPSIFSIKFDRVGKKWLRQLGMRAFLGDDSLLKGVRKLLEKEGLSVISPQDIFQTLLTPEGVLTKTKPSTNDLNDIARGIYVLNIMSKADVGQSIVVQEGIVIGMEAREGTQKLIERCGELKLSENKGGVLVKNSKIGQDESIDLPTIGPDTILQVVESNLSGIALGSKKTQIVDFDKTIDLANSHNVFIIGV